ncbi:MAG: thiol reductant ABC exporter subunit CydC [Eggerthellaceae bacterium]|jgi:ATP-binding cassette subfamily C protein CydC
MSSNRANSEKQRDRWVRPYFAKYRKPLALALVLGLAAFACSSMLMFTSGYLISATAERPYEGLIAVYYPMVFVQVFGLGKPIARYFERLSSHDWVFRMTSSLRVRLYRIIERSSTRVRSRYGTGDYLEFVAEDIGHLQNLYLRTIFPLVTAWLLYAAVIAALGWFDGWFALGMALILGVTVFLLPLVAFLVNRAREERRKAATARLYRKLTDNVLGANDWIFAGREHEYSERYAEDAAQVRKAQSSLDAYLRRNDLILSVVFGAAILITLAWAAGMFGGQFGGAANWIAAFTLGFFPLIDAFAPLSSSAAQATGYRDSIRRLNSLPDRDDDDVIDETAETRDESEAPNPSSDAIRICAKDLTFSYGPDSPPVVSNVNLDIAPGQHVAILGRSGVGKSTLASLLCGNLAPSAGTVSVDGHDACSLDPYTARFISLVQQQPYLFNRTLRDNLLIASPDAGDGELIAALHAVGLTELMDRLPKGLDTLVDEAGTRFSGGERHRIALARVLLANAPAVLLDEPTVGLDPVTEAALIEAFQQTLAGKTLIVITHHLQGIESFDRVIFLADGGIALDGSPAELERTSAHYRRLLAFDRGIA